MKQWKAIPEKGGIEMDKINLYVMNKDYCPDDDNIIQQTQCGDCKYYKGFEMSMGQP